LIGRRAPGLGLGVATLVIARAAWAVDPFEIQVYDASANAPGVPGLELHVNDVIDGRRTARPPELAPHHQTHFTFEPSFGVTSVWEVGAYVQTTWRADGHFDFSGVKLRSKLVTPPGWHAHARAGLNLEVSYLPATYDPGRWGAEIRPIIAWEDRRWLFAANPIVGVPVRGGDPTFEPAAMALVKVAEVVALGLEYYADLGPLIHPARLREQEQYLFEVANLLSIPGVELNLGAGEGLTASSNAFVAKLILGFTWDPAHRGDAPHLEPPRL
jgi:hypothetical protein